MFGKKKNDSFFWGLLARASGSSAKILLPESTDERVLECAAMATEQNICKIVLLGSAEKFVGVLPKTVLKKIEFLNPSSKELQLKYATKLVKLRGHKGVTNEIAQKLVCLPMYFSVLALKCGDVDGVVAGAITATPDVLRPAFQIVKTAPGQSIASSCMIVETKNPNLGENGVLLFADCGVVEFPSAEELCDIALQTAESAKDIAGFATPRVALLSYSTKSNAEKLSEGVQKVKDAFLLLRRKNSALIADGELQVDSALVPEVAKRKCPHSEVKGRANVLVMPNIEAGNIAYKIAGTIAGATTIGPIVQGLDKPVNDVSRGASAQEILGAVAVTVLQTKQKNKK